VDPLKIEISGLGYAIGGVEILTGIIFLPGAMVGMIIAGADPLEAVRLQIVVLYMLLGSVSIAAILVGTLSYRSFFTPCHQLRTAPPSTN
jgi:ABC-type iron transport system FetAB permease component